LERRASFWLEGGCQFQFAGTMSGSIAPNHRGKNLERKKMATLSGIESCFAIFAKLCESLQKPHK